MSLFQIITLICHAQALDASTYGAKESQYLQCATYFQECLAKGNPALNEFQQFDVCSLTRPAQILYDRVDAKVRETEREGK